MNPERLAIYQISRSLRQLVTHGIDWKMPA